MVQLIAKVVDLDGKPVVGTYLLVTLDEERLDQIMYRICDSDEHSDEDPDLVEVSYFCPYVEVFKPTSRALQKHLDRLMSTGQYIFLYERLITVPNKAKAVVVAPNMTISPGFAGFSVELKNGKTIIMEPMPGEIWESTIDILEHNNEVKGNKTQKEPEPAPKKTRSYFS